MSPKKYSDLKLLDASAGERLCKYHVPALMSMPGATPDNNKNRTYTDFSLLLSLFSVKLYFPHKIWGLCIFFCIVKFICVCGLQICRTTRQLCNFFTLFFVIQAWRGCFLCFNIIVCFNRKLWADGSYVSIVGLNETAI